MSTRLQESHLDDSHFGFRDRPPSPSFNVERSMPTKCDNTKSGVYKDDRLNDGNMSTGDFNGRSIAIDEEPPEHEDPSSVAKETQVAVEYDRLATDSYDSLSITRMVNQNVDKPSPEHCIVVSPHKFAERQKAAPREEVSDKFRFAPGPGPDVLKLRRPTPGRATSFSEQKSFPDLSPPSKGTAARIKQGRLGDGCSEINIPSRGLNRARKLPLSKEDELKTVANIANLEHSSKNKYVTDTSSFQESSRKVGAVQTQRHDMLLTRQASSGPPFRIPEASSAKTQELISPPPQYAKRNVVSIPRQSLSKNGACAEVVEQQNSELAAVLVPKHHLEVKNIAPVVHLESDVLFKREGKLNNADNMDSIPLTHPEDCNQKDSCTPCLSSVTRLTEPTSDSHKEAALEMLNIMQSHGNRALDHQSQPCVLSPSVNRPLLTTRLQPKELGSGCNPRLAPISSVMKANPPSSTGSIEALSSSKYGNEGFTTPSTSQVVDILKVMMESEEDKQRASGEIIEQQGRKITELVTHISTFQQQIQDLKQKNEEMTGKLSGYKERCSAYKAHINQVNEGQKALWERGEELKQARDDLVAKMEENSYQNLEAQRKVEEVRELFSAKVKQSLREAREKLTDQDRTIELLRHDLDKRLLDLQRERSLAERLQKQLNDKADQRDKMENLLKEHQENIAAQLVDSNNGIVEILNSKVYNQRIDECLILIKSLRDSEPKAPSVLEELIRLTKGFSERTENRLQEKGDRDAELKVATEEVITELRAHIKKMDSQRGDQARLNECIVQLRGDNARLSEQVCDRENKLSEVNSQVRGIKCELETCRGKLSATINELDKYRTLSAEESELRTQLQDLRELCTGLKAEVESANREAEGAKSGLRTSEEASAILQESIKGLKDALEQAKAKISAFENERVAYIESCKKEFENERLQTERDFNQRLEEQSEDHISLVSGLRRQKADTEEKKSALESRLDILQEELSQSRHMNSDLESVTNDLQAEIIALQVRSCTQEEEAGRFEKKLESFRERHASAAAELQIIRDLIQQCIDDTNRIGGETATKFEKFKDLTRTQLLKIEELSQVELKDLKEELANLQKQTERHLAIQESISRYLRAKGLIRSGDSVDKLVTAIATKSPLQDLGPDEPRFSVQFDPMNNESLLPIDQEASLADILQLEDFEASTIDPACLSVDTQYNNSIESQGWALEHTEYRNCYAQTKSGTSTTLENLQSPRPSNLDQHSGHQSPVLYDKLETSILDSHHSSPVVSLRCITVEPHFSKQDAALELEASKRAAHEKAMEVPGSKQRNLPMLAPISKQLSPNVARRRGGPPTSPQYQKNDRLFERTLSTDINIRKGSTYESDSKASEETSRRTPLEEPVLDLASIFADNFATGFRNADQLAHTGEYRFHNDKWPSKSNSPAIAKSENELQLPKMPIKGTDKLPRSILKRNTLVPPSGRQRPSESIQVPDDTTKCLKRIPPTERSRGSRYNRVASGNSITKQAAQPSRVTPNTQRHVATPLFPDIFSITDSPEVQDPRRNALKRSGSGLGSHLGLKGPKHQRR